MKNLHPAIFLALVFVTAYSGSWAASRNACMSPSKAAAAPQIENSIVDVSVLHFVEALQGQSRQIDPLGEVRVGGAGVVTSDVEASKDVIHIVDTAVISI